VTLKEIEREREREREWAIERWSGGRIEWRE
jgi:hypothetical protein